MPPLPPELLQALVQPVKGLPKRERTRRQLIDAAIQVFSARGVVAATIQEIAAVAGMTTGTVYNHFSAKEDLLEATGMLLADTLCRRITDSQQGIQDGAERMAIGNRRYIWLAQHSPAWALLLLDLTIAVPAMLEVSLAYARADLKLGVRQKRVRIASEAAAVDLIAGTVSQAMRVTALGLAPAKHDVAVATMVLRGLGMGFEEAAEVASRPLPDFPPLA